MTRKSLAARRRASKRRGPLRWIARRRRRRDTVKVFFTLGTDEQSNAPGGTAGKKKALLARSPQPVPVRILRPRRPRPSDLHPPASEATAEQPLFGEVALRPVLSAVCRSAPDLLADGARDFAVAALDVVDGWKTKTARERERSERKRKGKQRSDGGEGVAAGAAESGDEEDEGVWEGKGMMRWCLASASTSTSSSSTATGGAAGVGGLPSSSVKPAGKDKDAVTVRGTIQGIFLEDLEHWAAMQEAGEEEDEEEDDDDRELEVHLQLVSVRPSPLCLSSAFRWRIS